MNRVPSFDRRTSGVLMHLTSLPGPYGTGDLSSEAFRFVDQLADAGQTWWQMLPVGPTSSPPGNSPYSSPSAFAGSPYLISIETLVKEGLLDRSDVRGAPSFAQGEADYVRSNDFRNRMLRRAYERFAGATPRDRKRFDAFRTTEADWLDDDALYGALKIRFNGAAWFQWPPSLRDREPEAMADIRAELADEIRYHSFLQYLFDHQWRALHAHARKHGVFLIGDMPIFVNHDSVPVWVQPDLWLLDGRRMPRVVSGTPPDAFSKTGQRWGHPLYDWEAHTQENFAWWVRRLAGTFRRFDALRIDHFLGFNRMWSIPSRAASAKKGKWVKVPGAALLTAVKRSLGDLPIIAEDLGLLIPEAAALRDRFGLPGMRILQFGFDSPGNGGFYNRPYSYPPASVAYTGTHDNDTIAGFLKSLKPDLRKRLLAYAASTGREPHWDMIRAVMQSAANTVIFPMQDILGLDAGARMNTPGTADHNWRWRLRDDEFSKALIQKLRDLTILHDRGEAP